MSTGANEPTKPELAVLKLLWRSKELSARDIHSSLTDEFNWSYSTVRTVLDRMAEKGLISKDRADGANIYRAEVSKIAVLGRMIADFSSRVLEIDDAPSAAFYSKSSILSEKEIAQLEAQLTNERKR